MKSFSKAALSVTVLGFALTPCFAMAKESPPKNRVPIEMARTAATAAYHGGIQGEELEFEGGKWIYSFDLKSPNDKRVHEVHVDAISGKVLDVHTESASDEKKEAAEDANEN
jgi:hypothetical protein